MDSRARIRDAGEGANAYYGSYGYIFEIIYLRVMGEQYPHSAQLALQQELLLPISLRLGQIASATLQFVPQPAQSLLKYFLRALGRPGV